MKNKLTLLIDGNWLLQSRFSVMIDQFRLTHNESLREMAYKDLQERLARSINVIINRLPDIDNIILVTDGGSWRKKLDIPSQLTSTYKGNRIHDEQIDWNRIYKALNQLTDKCKELGITTCTYINSEGDDWMWYWSRKLNSDKINCIIWSSDNDLKQLVQVTNGCFTGWYNDKKGLYLHKDLQEPVIDDVDFFLTPYTNSPLINSLSQRVSISYIDPNDIILPKIICGDASDNIKSIIRYHNNGRNYGIGAKEWEKAQRSLNIHNIGEFLDKKEEIVKYFINNKKYIKYSDQINEQDLYEMIDYNTKLVWLDEKVIPDTIIQAMNQIEYKLYDISFIKNNYLILTNQENNIEEVFEGIDSDLPF